MWRRNSWILRRWRLRRRGSSPSFWRIQTCWRNFPCSCRGFQIGSLRRSRRRSSRCSHSSPSQGGRTRVGVLERGPMWCRLCRRRRGRAPARCRRPPCRRDPRSVAAPQRRRWRLVRGRLQSRLAWGTSATTPLSYRTPRSRSRLQISSRSRSGTTSSPFRRGVGARARPSIWWPCLAWRCGRWVAAWAWSRWTPGTCPRHGMSAARPISHCPPAPARWSCRWTAAPTPACKPSCSLAC
mmetsp:Transcript_68713/g.199029  ORF Transcript_68713/g.199029 Transcript_68713/m.199029 type:complete len:239 (-) Transcript_68713:118-834(-)